MVSKSFTLMIRKQSVMLSSCRRYGASPYLDHLDVRLPNSSGGRFYFFSFRCLALPSSRNQVRKVISIFRKDFCYLRTHSRGLRVSKPKMVISILSKDSCYLRIHSRGFRVNKMKKVSARLNESFRPEPLYLLGASPARISFKILLL